MKNLSIRLKITLWFTVTMIIVVIFAYLAVFAVSRQILIKTIQDSLVQNVENNVDEIEYHLDISQLLKTHRYDYLIKYGNGYLDIDDDFLSKVNEVYTSLYSKKFVLIYGSNPTSSITEGLDFKDSEIQKVRSNGNWYYVFDRKLKGNGLDDLWLRGAVSEEQGERQMSGLIRAAVILLPLLTILASAGGYLIAKHALKPVQKISWTAKQISEGNDLKRRIDIGDGDDELHHLAATFDEMFDRLERAFEQERQFTSDVSHELRTPMTVINAQCEYTLEEERTVEEYENAILVIRRQARKMTKLINHMLDFARLEMHTGKYTDICLDVSELVDAICSDMKLIHEHGITLEYATETVVLSVNPELFSRLLTNLVSNAYRYGRENGHIFVHLRREQTTLVLSVEDDGIGIEEKEQDKIFQRFYQTDSSRGGDGTGLGLAMVCEIAHYYNGTVDVESVFGHGSTFTVRLPGATSSLEI